MNTPHTKNESEDDELTVCEVQLFSTKVHALTLEQACVVIFRWINRSGESCRFVVTPNVDHILQLQSNEELRAAYRAASMVVADGWPIVMTSRFLRSPLPERVAGSDLVPALMSRWSGQRALRVFLLGAAPGVAETAAASISARYGEVNICGTYSPPLGFEQSEVENEQTIRNVNACTPDVLVVGLGAPKQEIWLHRFACRLNTKVAIAAGGTIDFFAGVQRRAPVWMQRCGMEWFHRLIMDPRRLGKRYLRNAMLFPKLIAEEYAKNR